MRAANLCLLLYLFHLIFPWTLINSDDCRQTQESECVYIHVCSHYTCIYIRLELILKMDEKLDGY